MKIRPNKIWMTTKEVSFITGFTQQYIRDIVSRYKKIDKKNYRKKGKTYLFRMPESAFNLRDNISVRHNKDGSIRKKLTQYLKDKETVEKFKPEKIDTIKRGKDDAVKKYGFDKLSLNQAQEEQARQKAAELKMKNDKAAGKLVDAGEVEQMISGLIVSSRSKILSIKGVLAPLFKEFIEDKENFTIVMNETEKIINDTLRELAIHTDENIK